MSKRISILGAGWLGLPLAQALLASGHQVAVSTTSEEKAIRLGGEGLAARRLLVTAMGIEGEIGDFFTNDLLIVTLPPGGRRDSAVTVNYPLKIEQIISAAQQAGASQVLFTSSTSVYGNPTSTVMETSPLVPTTASGKALVKVEDTLRQAFGDQATILRLAGLVGGNRQPGRWFAGRQDIPGGNVPVNLVHRKDVIRFIEAVIQQKRWGHIFNVCADDHPQKADFYPAAALAMGEAPPAFLLDGTAGKVVGNTLGKEMLGFEYDWSPV